MILTFTIICVLLGLLWFWNESRLSRLKNLTANIPRPKHYPVIGGALVFGRTSEDMLNGFMKIADHGPVAACWVGNQLYIVLSKVKEIQTLLSSNVHLKKAHAYDFLEPWLGPGLLITDGDEWRRKRKILTPAFHFKIVEQFVEVFDDSIKILITKLESEIGSKGFNVIDYIGPAALDILSETSMGVQINAQEAENHFVKAINDVALSVINRALKPWLFPKIIFDLTSIGKLFNKQVKVIHKFVDEVITTRRKRKDSSKSKLTVNDDLAIGQRKKLAFLDILLDYHDNGYSMTNEEIRNEMNTFMFAGHDTTSSGISFVLYALMKYPDVQEKLYREVQDILGDSDRYPTYQELKNMKYLDCVIDESMRLWPPVPYVGRRMTQDFQITPDYVLPAGCSVTILLYKLHRDPEVFPNPEVFDPDRFLPENSIGRNPYAFVPFSAGPRNCIGQRFAMLEVKKVVACIVKHFKLLPPIGLPDIAPSSELILKSLTGINLRLEKR